MDYYLIPNTLANDGSYIARPVVKGTYTEAELIDKILSKRNIISKPDLEAIIAALKETLAEIIKEGKGLNLPWLKLSYSIKGTFATDDSPRNAIDHPLEITVKAGALLTDTAPKIKLKRIISPDFGPRIGRFTDGISKTVNSQLTPGGIFEIIGERLRIDGNDSSAIGLYLQAQDGTETRIDILMRNDPCCVNGQLPDDLAPGDYKLVLKTQVGANVSRFVSDVREGISAFTLKVR